MEDKIKSKFGKIWPAHVGNLTRFLISCRKAFDGDLDMFLVLAVIGDQTFSQRYADSDIDYEQFRSGAANRTRVVNINLRSIERFSGIPRETARRKVEHLMKLGWVSRQSDGSLVATSKARTDLEPMTLASIEYIAGMMQLFTDVLAAERKPKRTRKSAGTRSINTSASHRD